MGVIRLYSMVRAIGEVDVQWTPLKKSDFGDFWGKSVFLKKFLRRQPQKFFNMGDTYFLTETKILV